MLYQALSATYLIMLIDGVHKGAYVIHLQHEPYM